MAPIELQWKIQQRCHPIDPELNISLASGHTLGDLSLHATTVFLLPSSMNNSWFWLWTQGLLLNSQRKQWRKMNVVFEDRRPWSFSGEKCCSFQQGISRDAATWCLCYMQKKPIDAILHYFIGIFNRNSTLWPFLKVVNAKESSL